MPNLSKEKSMEQISWLSPLVESRYSPLSFSEVQIYTIVQGKVKGIMRLPQENNIKNLYDMFIMTLIIKQFIL